MHSVHSQIVCNVRPIIIVFFGDHILCDKHRLGSIYKHVEFFLLRFWLVRRVPCNINKDICCVLAYPHGVKGVRNLGDTELIWRLLGVPLGS